MKGASRVYKKGLDSVNTLRYITSHKHRKSTYYDIKQIEEVREDDDKKGSCEYHNRRGFE